MSEEVLLRSIIPPVGFSGLGMDGGSVQEFLDNRLPFVVEWFDLRIHSFTNCDKNCIPTQIKTIGDFSHY